MPTTTSTQGTQFRTGSTVAQDTAARLDTGGIADTIGTTTSVSAPALGTSAGFLATPPPGVYKVKFTILLTGTAETQLANLVVKINGANTALVLPSISAFINTIEIPRLTITSSNLQLVTVANATAGSVYTVTIIASRIE